MMRTNFIPVQAFSNVIVNPSFTPRSNISQSNVTKTRPPLETKTIITIVLIVVLIVGILVSVVIVPVVLIAGKTVTEAKSETTAATSNTVYIQWNAIATTVAGDSNTSVGVSSNLLNFPVTITLGSGNTIYIADSYNNRIQKWTIGSSTGNTVAGWSNGAANITLDALWTPISVVLDNNENMYISDYTNHRVMYWINGASSGSVYVGTTGIPGNSTSELYHPTGLYLDQTTGNLYIADSFNHRILRYALGASSGTIVAGGNGVGIRSTQLCIPSSVFFDATTNSLIISNIGTHNVVRWVIGASSWTLLAGSATGRSGSTAVLLRSPNDAILDRYGNLYIADRDNHRIQCYFKDHSNGTTIAGITRSLGTNANSLNWPCRLALDRQSNLYVADSSNNRIQKFSRI